MGKLVLSRKSQRAGELDHMRKGWGGQTKIRPQDLETVFMVVVFFLKAMRRRKRLKLQSDVIRFVF